MKKTVDIRWGSGEVVFRDSGIPDPDLIWTDPDIVDLPPRILEGLSDRLDKTPLIVWIPPFIRLPEEEV
jgi:hypothetical protein